MSLVQSKEEKHFIHNHFTFLVKYHKDANTDIARIVAFEVKPYRCNIHPSFLNLWAIDGTMLAMMLGLYMIIITKFTISSAALSMNMMVTGRGMLHPLKPVIHTRDV